MALTDDQQSKVKLFIEFSNVEVDIAVKALKDNSWNFDRAINAYMDNPTKYSQPTSTASTAGRPIKAAHSRSTATGTTAQSRAQEAAAAAERSYNLRIQQNKNALESIFGRFKDVEMKEKDQIGLEGLGEYLSELGYSIQDDQIVFLILHHLGSESGPIPKKAFMEKWNKLECYSMDAMKNLIKTKWEAEYQTKDGLRHAYQMYFDIAKGEEKKRNIPREAAVESWRDMLANHPIYKAAQQKFGRVGLLAEWCEFVENHANLAVITRDTWTQALEFLTTAQPELANHSEANAWPVLIDEFVAAMRKKHGWAKSAAAEEELYNFDDPYA